MNKTAEWIWYPGDFEMWLNLRVATRRLERGTTIPVFWKLEHFNYCVSFSKRFGLQEPEEVRLHVDGKFHVVLDGVRRTDFRSIFTLPAGKHEITVTVVNLEAVPSIYMQGKTVVTDNSWEAGYSGLATEKASSGGFNDPHAPPSEFSLERTEIRPVKIEKSASAYLIDFGKETYASLKLAGITGNGQLSVYYGESLEEALAPGKCVLWDKTYIGAEFLEGTGSTEGTGCQAGIGFSEGTGFADIAEFPARAFRYIQIAKDPELEIKYISAMYEYLPLEQRGGFRCSDDRINTIWDTSLYTLHLNAREFFLDGIKRDGWVWSGDAYQAFLMDYYSFFDESISRRTLTVLRGKDPVTSHINTIMDYTFYWFIGLYDYYMYTGDLEYISQSYDKACTLMDYCLGRRNSEGMMEGMDHDWVFIDWADMEKAGEVCAEQLLFCRSLEAMSVFAQLLGHSEDSTKYKTLESDLRSRILKYFWDEQLGGLVTTRINGVLSKSITRHSNIFGILFRYFTEEQAELVKDKVIKNDDVKKIKTPYFRFYEMAALCELGEQDYVLHEILDYWGGMLDQGATTFWEEYDPSMKGTEHYAMYGEPFDKSLCHAWGASPIYLLGRYFLGVCPAAPGYKAFEIKPVLGGLDWMEGVVPTPNGKIEVYMDRSCIKVKASEGRGLLRFHSSRTPAASLGTIVQTGASAYELSLDAGVEYDISYMG